MSYGYSRPRYGMRDAQGGYQRPQAPRAQSPNNRGGMMGPAPFPSLASGNVHTGAPAGGNIVGGGVRGGAPGNYSPPHAPAAPRPQPQPQAQPEAPQPSYAYDYNTDPILQQIQALGTQQRSDAQTGSLEAKKKLAIDYGDSALARNVLGDENTAQAASQNPFSVFAQLGKQHETNTHNLDEYLNQQNGFYSGARIKQQGDLTNQYQGSLAQATGEEQGYLGGIDQGLSAALMAADDRDRQAQSSAADRALQMALMYGIDPGAGQGAEAAPAEEPTDAASLGGASPDSLAEMLFGSYFDEYGRPVRRGGR